MHIPGLGHHGGAPEDIGTLSVGAPDGTGLPVHTAEGAPPQVDAVGAEKTGTRINVPVTAVSEDPVAPASPVQVEARAWDVDHPEVDRGVPGVVTADRFAPNLAQMATGHQADAIVATRQETDSRNRADAVADPMQSERLRMRADVAHDAVRDSLVSADKAIAATTPEIAIPASTPAEPEPAPLPAVPGVGSDFGLGSNPAGTVETPEPEHAVEPSEVPPAPQALDDAPPATETPSAPPDEPTVEPDAPESPLDTTPTSPPVPRLETPDEAIVPSALGTDPVLKAAVGPEPESETPELDKAGLGENVQKLETIIGDFSNVVDDLKRTLAD